MSRKWYVVDVQTIAIDSEWDYVADANDRAIALKEENGGTPVKVMTRPAVGGQKLDPNDPASWKAKRRANPGKAPEVEVGSYWRKKTRDPHNRVYKVVKCDGDSVVCADVVHGDKLRMKCSAFLAEFTRGGENPARKPPGRHGGIHATASRQSGYTNCACPGCNDVAVSSDIRKPSFCLLCKEAKCSRSGDSCQRADANDELLENPGELLIVNGADTDGPDSAKAEKVFEMWHKKLPNNVSRFRPGVDASDVMVCVGTANDIVYRSSKWERGRKSHDYIHVFDSKPKVWMLADVVGVDSGNKTVESLLSKSKNKDGQFAVADLAAPISFSVDGPDGPEEIAIHSGARVYGGVDQRTVIIADPKWKLIVIRGGQMTFDERGIVK